MRFVGWIFRVPCLPHPAHKGRVDDPVSERLDESHVSASEHTARFDVDGHLALVMALASIGPSQVDHTVHGLFDISAANSRSVRNSVRNIFTHRSYADDMTFRHFTAIHVVAVGSSSDLVSVLASSTAAAVSRRPPAVISAAWGDQCWAIAP